MRSVTWVLEDNLIAESLLAAMIAALREQDLPFYSMRFTPFSYNPIGAVPMVEGPCVVYGAAGVQEHAARVGWKPGAWMSDAFTPQNYAARLGKLYLNSGHTICKLSKVPDVAHDLGLDKFFMRPNGDGKNFTSGPTSLVEVAEWLGKLRKENLILENDVLVSVAALQTIGREWRTVVVNGKPIAWSQYKKHGRRWDDPSIEPEALQLALAAAAKFAPADVFVADVCETPDGMKIVEYNTFNSAGLYACDVKAVVSEISAFVAG